MRKKYSCTVIQKSWFVYFRKYISRILGYEVRQNIKRILAVIIGNPHARLENSYINRKLKTNALPLEIVIDSINLCNLRCPLCKTGVHELNRPLLKMELDNFKDILDKIEFSQTIYLIKWGEAFLHPNIFEMIKLCKKRGKKVHLNSNFTTVKDEHLEKIIDSALDELVISLDGVSQETYVKYRVGGQFEMAFGNMVKLVQLKEKKKANTPYILWKFLVNRYNEHEVEKAKQLADDNGIEIKFAPIYLNDVSADDDGQYDMKVAKEWLPKDNKYFYDSRLTPIIEDACPHLWKYPVIQSDGGISPCCHVTSKEHDFGNLLEGSYSSFHDIWNNEKYQYSRSLFTNEKYDGKNKGSICDTCRIYRKD